MLSSALAIVLVVSMFVTHSLEVAFSVAPRPRTRSQNRKKQHTAQTDRYKYYLTKNYWALLKADNQNDPIWTEIIKKRQNWVIREINEEKLTKK